MGSNLDQERTDVCKQELIIAEIYTSFNHNNTNYIIITSTLYIYIIIISTKLNY
jgi:hypothetical protein